MNSSEEEELALFTFVLIDDESRAERKKKRKHRFWIREIYKQRDKQGVFSNLLRELRLGDREFFQVRQFYNIITQYFLYILVTRVLTENYLTIFKVPENDPESV